MAEWTSIMPATKLSRIAARSLALFACGAMAFVYGIQYMRSEPPVETKAVTGTRVVAPPTSSTQNQRLAVLSPVPAQASALADALPPSPPLSHAADGVPSFDVARIESTGEAVIAGRAAPGATVELLRDGEPQDRAIADQSGQFVMIPPPLPPGNYELTLRSKQPDGGQAASSQSVAVAIERGPRDKPVAALLTPDRPTVVLSQPAPHDPIGGKVTVETIETERGGKLYVSGHSSPGSAVRLYLNDSFLASSTAAAADGRFAFTIDGGVKPGGYHVRLDEMASNSGTVRSRAEVPFNVSDTVQVASSLPGLAASSKPQDTIKLAAAMAAAAPDSSSPSSVIVPKIVTTKVVPPAATQWEASGEFLG